VERLCALVERTGVDQVQTRPLAIDPDVYLDLARERGAGGPALGIRALVGSLRRARPGLVVGNFSRAPVERRRSNALPAVSAARHTRRTRSGMEGR
jgi:hypothetical protein